MIKNEVAVMTDNRSDSEIEKAFRYAEASLNVEGMYTTDEEKALIKQSLRGDISKEEFIKRAVEIARNG